MEMCINQQHSGIKSCQLYGNHKNRTLLTNNTHKLLQQSLGHLLSAVKAGHEAPSRIERCLFGWGGDQSYHLVLREAILASTPDANNRALTDTLFGSLEDPDDHSNNWY